MTQVSHDPFLAAMTEVDCAARVSECNENIAEVSKLYPTDASSRIKAYWLKQRYEALTELYSRQKRRAM